MAAGNYSTDTPKKQENYGHKNLTFVGQPENASDVVWQIGAKEPNPDYYGTEYNGDYSFDSRGKTDEEQAAETLYTVTFKNLTLQTKAQDYLGFIGIDNTVVENCILNGKTFYWGYTSATFKNCTFNCPNGDYAVWTYSSPTMTFDGCTFNSYGKVINVYTDYSAGKYDITVNYKDCTVNNKDTDKKAVLKINDSNMGDYKYIINISGKNKVYGIDVADYDDLVAKDEAEAAGNKDVKVDGIDARITCSRLFGFDEAKENASHTVVTINGETVWKDGKRTKDHNDYSFTKGSYVNNTDSKPSDWNYGIQYTEGHKDKKIIKSDKWVGNTHYTTYTCQYCGWTKTFVTEKKWDIDVSKTATALTKDYTTDVTLSVPSVEEALASDVVFVLDGSSSAETAVVEESLKLLKDLKASVEDSGAAVNVCIVKFKRQAFKSEWFDLSTQFDDIKSAMEKKYSGGTNIHAGLLAGLEALQDHENISESKKYLILISDGSTYLYSKDGDWASDTPFTRSYYTKENYQNAAGSFNDQGNYNPDNYPAVNVQRPKNTSEVAAWQKYLKDVKARNAESNGDAYDYHCEYDNNFNKGIPSADFKSQPCNERTANNRDMAFYYADQVWQQIKAAGYNAFSIAEKDDSAGAGNADDSHCFMNYLNEGKSLNFSDIEKEILYAVDKGSTVTDVIGNKFTLNEDSLTVTVGGEKLNASGRIPFSIGGGWTQSFWYEGKSIEESSFEVEYFERTQTLKWTFNEAVSNFAPVSLSYKITLTNPETRPGTYGKLDLDGSKYVETDKYPNALYTNESAVLNPMDSQGTQGTPVYFPMPSLEYTVRRPYIPPTPTPDPEPTPDPAKKIIVTITGNTGSEVYDATEHNVKGYTWECTDPSYTEDDFEFTGTADAKGTYVGKYDMGIKADQFKNLNSAYDVEFVVETDGELDITKKPLTITAGSAEGYGPEAITCDTYTATELAKGDKLVSVKITGKQSVPGSSANVASDAVIQDASGKDVTANYEIKYVNGTLTMLEILNKEDHFNYVIGYPDETVRPNANITRAEVATIFFRLLTDDGRKEFDTRTSTFSDVADGQWYTRAIATLANAKIVSGYPDGSFRPNDSITRAEMATIIARFANLSADGKTFSDIKDHWAQKYIELAAGNGWINGYSDGSFGPDKKITRAETFAMINRVLDRQTESNDDLLPASQMLNWSDNADTTKWYYRDMQEATNNHKCERIGDSKYEKWTEKLPEIDWASYQI